MDISRDHATVAVKVGAVVVGGMAMPGVGHWLGGLLGGAAIDALMDPNRPGGKWLQSLGDHVALGLADRLIAEHRQARGAKANGHVAKLLLTAAADAIEGAQGADGADAEIAEEMATGLRKIANDAKRAPDFFDEAPEAAEGQAPSDEEIWANMASPETLEAAYWPCLRDALATAVMHLPHGRKADVARTLDALKSPILEGMGRELVTVIQSDGQIQAKLDTYFKRFVADSLTEQSRMLGGLGRPALRSFDFEPDEEWRTRNRFRADADWTTYHPIAPIEDALDGFIEDAGRVRWFVLTGAGGAGKSRAARERARACLARGWRVWEYGGGSHGPAEGKETNAWRQWRFDRPTLIVVDYASACPIRVADAIRELQARAADLEHRVRFLLLERAYGSGATWSEAFEKEGGSPLAKAKHGGGSLAAPILTETDYFAIAEDAYEKRAAMAEGGAWAKGEAGSGRRAWPGDEAANGALRSVFDGQEETDEDARPLYAMFAGEAIADQGPDHIREWNPTDLVRFALRREIDRWAGEGGADEAHLNLLLLATLCGGVEERDFAELRKDRKFGLPAGGELHPDCYRRLVTPRPQRTGAEYGPLLPDLLGELFAFERLVGGCLLSGNSERALATGPALALLAWAAGEPRAEAGPLLAKAVQDFPDHAAVALLFETQGGLLAGGFFARGLALVIRGQPERSLREWEHADRAGPRNASILSNWGVSLGRMAALAPEEKRAAIYEQACEKHEAATKANPGNAMAHNNWGTALAEMAPLAPEEKREALYRQACEKFEAAAKPNPDFAAAHFNWGTALAEMAALAPEEKREALYRQACEEFGAATNANPGHAEAYVNWGSVLTQRAALAPEAERDALYEQACEKYAAAVNSNPADDAAYFNWGLTLGRMADLAPEEQRAALYRQACEAFEAATNANPDDDAAYFNWGNALGRMADLAPEEQREALYQQACEKYEAATKANPDFAEAYVNWGNALAEMAALAPEAEREALYPQACEKLEAATKANPANAAAYFNWGLVLGQMAAFAPEAERAALYRQACEKHEAAANADPDFAAAHFNWGHALVKMADFATGRDRRRLLEEARKRAGRGCELAPEEVACRLLLDLIEYLLRGLDDEKS